MRAKQKSFRLPISLAQILTMFFVLNSICCGSQVQDIKANNDIDANPEKILIIYLSRTNNTKAIAEIIHDNTGGRLVNLELKHPYPEDYKAIVAQVVKENETGFLPPLKTVIDSFQKFEIVFLGFPTWGMQLPPPIKSLLNQCDFNGKTIIPFNTHGGYGIGSSFETVKKLCPGSKVLDGFSTKGGVERDGILFVMEGEKQKQVTDVVKKWLQEIKIIK